MEKFSLIVPIFNAEAYLEMCCVSILEQTYKDLELILVNDGSTDASARICDNLAKKDNRVKVIHLENHGVSYARNIGIKCAKGTRVLFVDSDDWIERNTIENLSQLIEEKDADVVMFTYNMEYANTSKKYEISEIRLETKEFLRHMPDFEGSESMLCTVWNKVYKLDIIQSNNILFPLDVKVGEDFIFNTKYFMSAKNINTINKVYYHYRCFSENSAIKCYYPQYSQYIILMDTAFKDMLEYFNLQDKNIITYYLEFISRRWEYAVETCMKSCVSIKEKADILYLWYASISLEMVSYSLKKSGLHAKLCMLINVQGLSKKSIRKEIVKFELMSSLITVKCKIRGLIRNE